MQDHVISDADLIKVIYAHTLTSDRMCLRKMSLGSNLPSHPFLRSFKPTLSFVNGHHELEELLVSVNKFRRRLEGFDC